jgi:hypothetical protein
MNRSNRSPLSLRAGMPPGLEYCNEMESRLASGFTDYYTTRVVLTERLPPRQSVRFLLECSP